jgi:hypothetical protein
LSPNVGRTGSGQGTPNSVPSAGSFNNLLHFQSSPSSKETSPQSSPVPAKPRRAPGRLGSSSTLVTGSTTPVVSPASRRALRVSVFSMDTDLAEQGNGRPVLVQGQVADLNGLMAVLSRELAWPEAHAGLSITRLFNLRGVPIAGIDDLGTSASVIATSGSDLPANFIPTAQPLSGTPRSTDLRNGISTLLVWLNGANTAKTEPAKVILRPLTNMATLLQTIARALGLPERRPPTTLYTKAGVQIIEVAELQDRMELIVTCGEPFKPEPQQSQQETTK